jgi:hypothetical protein
MASTQSTDTISSENKSSDTVPQVLNSCSGMSGHSNLTDEKLIKVEFKKRAFDREFRAFVKQAQETINARYGMSIEFGDVRAELVCLNRYLSIYNNMDPQEHYRYFETLYNRKRSEILNCLKDDRWIRTGNLVIQFGEGIRSSPEIEEKRKQVRIMISDIFLIACDLQTQAERALDGIDEKFAQAAGGKDLIRPSILLLHLIRIFYQLNDCADKAPLGEIVTHLETDLFVTKITVGEEHWNASVQTTATTESPSSTGGFSGLFTMATSMMEKMGYKPPPGMKPPSETEISTVISTVFNNETTQNAIQGMFSSLQGCTDFGSAVQEVVKNVTDPKTMEAIQGSVMQTAQLAALDNSQPSSSTNPPIISSPTNS